MLSILSAAGAAVGTPVYPPLPSHWELAARVLLAAVLGGCIGLERELNDHPSGLRTHIAVAIGSALFAICSAYAWHDYVALRNDNNYNLDPTRIAAQIVSGVGFLGAGAIIKQGNTVRGLTSAAGLWVSASVGLAVALDLYIEATAATVVLLVALLGLRAPRRWLRSRLAQVREEVVITIPIEIDPSQIINALSSIPEATIRSLVVKPKLDEGISIIETEIQVRGGMLESRLASIENRTDVLSVEVN